MDLNFITALPAASAGLGLIAISVRASIRRERRTLAELDELRASLWMAEHVDPMTGLRNRRTLIEELTARQAQGGSWSLVRFDLDKFGAVNKRYGHENANFVLQEVARRLEIGAGEHGLAMRMHGDEFAIIAPYSADIAAPVMERVAESVACPIRIQADPTLIEPASTDQIDGDAAELVITVTTSVGLVDGDSTVDLTTLLDRADLAVYVSKGSKQVEVWQPPAATAVQLPGSPTVTVADLDSVPLVFAGGVR
ncbi:GGDEF domain-containing protein [Hamadaea sp. NPDC051192]|uniref:GGDEF domain-containing protein n=1 Tax=Hamadaea sp. NPDC051192 TaxID=3154940 RepID=UPI0034470BF7